MLQLREQLSQYEEGNVLVCPVGGVGGDGRDVRVAGLPDTVVHPVGQSLAVWQVELLANSKLLQPSCRLLLTMAIGGCPSCA